LGKADQQASQVEVGRGRACPCTSAHPSTLVLLVMLVRKRFKGSHSQSASSTTDPYRCLTCVRRDPTHSYVRHTHGAQGSLRTLTRPVLSIRFSASDGERTPCRLLRDISNDRELSETPRSGIRVVARPAEARKASQCCCRSQELLSISERGGFVRSNGAFHHLSSLVNDRQEINPDGASTGHLEPIQQLIPWYKHKQALQ
jgi:hypothetical protein